MKKEVSRDGMINEFLENMGALRRITGGAFGNAGAQDNLPTRAQFGIMMVLAREGAKTGKELAQEFCMSPSAATQLVEALVQSKHVLRKEDAVDRRKAVISLTASGKQMLLKAKKQRLRAFAKLLDPLDESELAELLRLQRKIFQTSSQA